MEVHKARAFLVLAETLHFGRAAHTLHMAQPPLSRLMRSLEAELGASLFDRNTRQVRLTAVGEALIEPARELVMQSERIPDLVRRVQRGETGRIRLGFAGASLSTAVSAIARRVRREHPHLTLELSGSQLSQAGLRGLLDGTLDAVVGRWDYLPDDISSQVIAQEELLVALPGDHPLASAEALALEDIAEEPWVVLPGGREATLSNRLHLLGQRGRFIPRVVETAIDSTTQLLLVDASVGIALTFSGVRDNLPSHDVVFRPIVPTLGPVDIRLAWLASNRDPALQTVTELVAETHPYFSGISGGQ